ncbi:MAG: SBBP repeat-containing protein [Candidatus Heimdallarchaeota archaeon]|nr:MAG: SBBP repeat-containing protein [Candidatus Heimdallarchaeota archaeon]
MKNKNELKILSFMVTFLLTIYFISCISTISPLPERHMQVEITDFVYSTYLGGSMTEDQIRDVIIDSQENIIVTGLTLSTDFPILDAFQDTFAGGGYDNHGVGGDAFLTKFDKEGQLLWSTFLGGSSMDGGLFVEAVESDNIIVVGMSQSNDFPITDDAYQQDNSGYYDIFITKFSSNGSLLYSSYLGTSGNDYVNDCEIDYAGNLVISGGTDSANFPVTPDAAQPIMAGGSDGFLMRISANCSTIVYSTFLGGSSYEGIDKIAVDSQDNIITTGFTGSQDFPVTEDAYQDFISSVSHRDFFIAKHNSSGQLIYATYFGGSHMDDCFGVAVDSIGDIIITGRTWSSDFPTVNAWQENYSHIEVDGFVAKLTADGQELVFSSYFGGSAWDTVHHVNIDSNDNIFVSGIAGPDGFPLIDAFQTVHGESCDVIIMKISPAGQPLFSSYLGGLGQDHPWHQYFSNDNLYIVGMTASSDFFTTDNGYQQTLRGNQDGFLFRIDIEGYLAALPPDSSQTSSGTIKTITSVITTETTIDSETTPGFNLIIVLIVFISFSVIKLRNCQR